MSSITIFKIDKDSFNEMFAAAGILHEQQVFDSKSLKFLFKRIVFEVNGKEDSHIVFEAEVLDERP